MKIQISQPLLIHEIGKRVNQEDSYYPLPNQATPKCRLFVVCDGMGGLDKGEIASSIVCETFSSQVQQALNRGSLYPRLIQKALENAYLQLCRNSSSFSGTMGTTLVALCLSQSKAVFAHIGDSRGYLISPSRHLVMHTKDHSLVQQLCDMGQITEQEMQTHPKRNILMRAVLPYPNEVPIAEITPIQKIVKGDYLMLCSDGIVEQHHDSELLALFSDNTLSDKEKVQKLRQMTQNNNDNHTAYIIPVASVADNKSIVAKWTLFSLVLVSLLLVCYCFFTIKY